MTHLPTSHDVKQLAHHVARDGLERHRAAVTHLIEATRQSGHFPGAVAAMIDPTTAEVARNRAFMTVVRNWDQIETAASRRCRFDSSLEAFLTQWNEHHELRKTRDIERLGTSRSKLDSLRSDLVCARPD